eukprot:gene9760-11564_t
MTDESQRLAETELRLRARRVRLEEEELDLKEHEVRMKQRKLEQQQCDSQSQGECVTLNVGGVHYETTLSTLNKTRYFAAQLGPEALFRSTHTSRGQIFVDRNGELFSEVLEWLRSGTFDVAMPDKKRAALLEEAAFYGIESLLCRLQGKTDPTQLREEDRQMRHAEMEHLKVYMGPATYADILAGEQRHGGLIDVLGNLESFTRKDARELELPLILDEHIPPMLGSGQRMESVCALRAPLGGRATPASIFKERFNEYSGGLLDDLDCTNLVFAGGSVLTCLTHASFPRLESLDRLDQELQRELLSSDAFVGDIDIFLVGLSPEQAAAKLEQICVQLKANAFRKGKTSLFVVRGTYAVTFVRGFPLRHVQGTPPLVVRTWESPLLVRKWQVTTPLMVILHCYQSPIDVVMHFDIDCCCVLYDGDRVLCQPRARRAINHRVNVADTDMRSPTYEKRLTKYSGRGFAVAVPGLDTTRLNPALFNAARCTWDGKWISLEDSAGKTMRVAGLAKLLVASRGMKDPQLRLPSAETQICSGQETEEGVKTGDDYDPAAAVRLPFDNSHKSAETIQGHFVTNLIAAGFLKGETTDGVRWKPGWLNRSGVIEKKKATVPLDVVWDLLKTHPTDPPSSGLVYVKDACHRQVHLSAVDEQADETLGELFEAKMNVPRHIKFTTYEDTTPLTMPRPRFYHDYSEMDWFENVYK